MENALDVGCGPSPYMLELGKRGYAFAGLDRVRRCLNGRFKFVGWYNNFDLSKPLEKAAKFNRPIILLRRKWLEIFQR